MAKWMRFRLANSEQTILVNMDVDVLVEQCDVYINQHTSRPGMMVCGQQVEGSIDDLALRLSVEDFLP
jgi:hypothetical protein